jgi:hypothetical protein
MWWSTFWSQAEHTCITATFYLGIVVFTTYWAVFYVCVSSSCSSMWPVSLEFPFSIAPSVFYDVYLINRKFNWKQVYLEELTWALLQITGGKDNVKKIWVLLQTTGGKDNVNKTWALLQTTGGKDNVNKTWVLLQTMRTHIFFTLSLPPVVCRRTHVLFTLSLPPVVCRRTHIFFTLSLPPVVCESSYKQLEVKIT